MPARLEKLKQSLKKRTRRLNPRFAPLKRLNKAYQRALDRRDDINLEARYQDARKRSPTSPDTQALKHELEASLHALEDMRQAVAHRAASPQGLSIPKKIWIYWDTGLEQAPEVVQLGYRSWVTMNPDHEVHFLDAENIQHYADFQQVFKLLSLDVGAAHRSDYIRTFMLACHGGIWADSTTFCWEPLSDWLHEETQESGFFTFRQEAERKDRQIKNWFIASSPGNPIMQNQFHELTEYNFKPRSRVLTVTKPKHYLDRPGISREGTGHTLLASLEEEGFYPYFYYHYLFNEAVHEGIARERWSQAQQASNRHVSKHGQLESAAVSKQTYRGQYPSSNEYQNRKQQLEQLLKAHSGSSIPIRP